MIAASDVCFLMFLLDFGFGACRCLSAAVAQVFAMQCVASFEKYFLPFLGSLVF